MSLRRELTELDEIELTATIQDLVAKGYVTLLPNEQWWDGPRVELTAKGQQVLAEEMRS